MRTPRPVLPLLLWLVAIQSVFAFDEDSSFTIPYPSRDFTRYRKPLGRQSRAASRTTRRLFDAPPKRTAALSCDCFISIQRRNGMRQVASCRILSCAKCSLFGETTILPRLLLGSLLKFRRACPATLE